MKKPTILPLLVLIATLPSCTSTSGDLLSELIFGSRKSRKDKRAEHYEDRGFSKKKASRLAAEDEFWSNAKPAETPEQSSRWQNPSYPD